MTRLFIGTVAVVALAAGISAGALALDDPSLQLFGWLVFLPAAGLVFDRWQVSVVGALVAVAAVLWAGQHWPLPTQVQRASLLLSMGVVIAMWALMLATLGYWQAVAARQRLAVEGLARKQQELAQAQLQVQEALRGQDDFLSIVFHEVPQPLDGIRGMSSLLRQTTLSEEAVDLLGDIENHADRLRQILASLRPLAGDLASGRTSHEQPYSFRDVSLAAARQASGWTQAPSVVLDPCLPDRLWGSPARVGALLGQLLTLLAASDARQGRNVTIDGRTEDDDKVALTFWWSRDEDRQQAMLADVGAPRLELSLCARMAASMGGDMSLRHGALAFRLPIQAPEAGRANAANGGNRE